MVSPDPQNEAVRKKAQRKGHTTAKPTSSDTELPQTTKLTPLPTIPPTSPLLAAKVKGEPRECGVDAWLVFVFIPWAIGTTKDTTVPRWNSIHHHPARHDRPVLVSFITRPSVASICV